MNWQFERRYGRRFRRRDFPSRMAARNICSGSAGFRGVLPRDRQESCSIAFSSSLIWRSGERPSYAELAAQNGLTVPTVTNYLAWSRRELRRFAAERIDSVTPNCAERREESRLLWRMICSISQTVHWIIFVA